MEYAMIYGKKDEGKVELFVLGSLTIIGWAVLAPASFAKVTTASWFSAYIMGFFKLFFLGTLGEIIKYRIIRGTWTLDKPFQRAFVWGFFGIWFTAAFPAFGAASQALIAKGLWPKFLPALSASLSINLFGGFALFMMVVHEYGNFLIWNNWRKWSLTAFSQEVDKQFIFAYLPKTLLFWIPAHWFTYSQPPEWRVLIAAVLAIALGFFLSVGKRRAVA
ncbi:MAG: hypothetical protein WCT33_02895 [Patescibacteria group bacterium]|jgi:hypothetical protein